MCVDYFKAHKKYAKDADDTLCIKSGCTMYLLKLMHVRTLYMSWCQGLDNTHHVFITYTAKLNTLENHAFGGK